MAVQAPWPTPPLTLGTRSAAGARMPGTRWVQVALFGRQTPPQPHWPYRLRLPQPRVRLPTPGPPSPFSPADQGHVCGRLPVFGVQGRGLCWHRPRPMLERAPLQPLHRRLQGRRGQDAPGLRECPRQRARAPACAPPASARRRPVFPPCASCPPCLRGDHAVPRTHLPIFAPFSHAAGPHHEGGCQPGQSRRDRSSGAAADRVRQELQRGGGRRTDGCGPL